MIASLGRLLLEMGQPVLVVDSSFKTVTQRAIEVHLAYRGGPVSIGTKPVPQSPGVLGERGLKTSDTNRMRQLPGDQRLTTRGADRCVAIGVVEGDTLSGQSIDVRRRTSLVPGKSQCERRLIIGQD